MGRLAGGRPPVLEQSSAPLSCGFGRPVGKAAYPAGRPPPAEPRTRQSRLAPGRVAGGLLAALLVLLGAPAWAGPTSTADALLTAGDYAKAEAAYARSRSPASRLGLARVQLVTGRYTAAVASARQAARGKLWPRAMTVLAEAQRRSGQVAKAEATLKAVVAKHPGFHRARIRLGLVLLEQGKSAEAKPVFDQFYDDFAGDRIDKSSAEQLTYVAMACRYTDNFRDASDTLADAVKLDPKHVEAWVQWAEISLEKYEAGYAEKHYGSALKANPNLPRALIGLARVKLEQTYDVDEALRLLKRAEKVNPFSVEARVVRAQILVDAERNPEAEALLNEALKVNPRDLDALSMMAASHFLRDDDAGFKKIKARVLKLNPRYTRLFHTVVELGVRHHRYREAIDLGKEAIAIDPNDWYSLADLGTNYLRLGDEKNGLAYLKQAWKGDPFNVRNYNLLNLFDDVVAKEYTFISSKHFRLRVHKEEQGLVKRVVVPLLEKAYGIYVKKYRFTPKLPIGIELFRDPNHYAVRTVGVPGLSALAVCFGQVITATSPMAGRFNWGQVLWHELNHVFTIQITRSRVPRWLTEGLADLEPTLERPEWKRENDFDIYRALRANRLRGLSEMSTAFSRAKDIQEMVVAYYQGSLMAGYLVKHFGMGKVLEALKGYGRGQRTPQVLPRVTGLDLDELDRRFQAEERRRLAYYGKGWFVDPEAYGDLKARQQDAAARPQDAAAQAALAMALLVAGKGDEAAKQADLTLQLAPTERVALFARAQISLARGKRKEAAQALERLIKAGGDGYEPRLALGRLALARGDLAGGARHLAAAKRFDPEQPSPWAMLARAYAKAKRTDEQIAELKGLVQLDQQSFGPVATLIKLLAKRNDQAGVRRYGQMAYYINPASTRLHTLLAAAWAAPAPRPDLGRAIWHLETALLTGPKRPADIQHRLAELYLARGDRRHARAAVDAALKADPGHAGARALKAKLSKTR